MFGPNVVSTNKLFSITHLLQSLLSLVRLCLDQMLSQQTRHSLLLTYCSHCCHWRCCVWTKFCLNKQDILYYSPIAVTVVTGEAVFGPNVVSTNNTFSMTHLLQSLLSLVRLCSDQMLSQQTRHSLLLY